MVVGCPVLVLIAATNNGIIMNIKIAAITPLTPPTHPWDSHPVSTETLDTLLEV